ncbi:hypothetical protein GCM10009679_58450 [Saccharothrix algeriensis]|uniref:Uncharacterized protein n=1 Tax=Catellatospora bangladeshensis TaxID=310355 RepID=A0A8J3JW71_9ACTN|nr:hypothetical protein Cba03nite_75120 [Catellatospora bangladeshensis]
MQHALSGQKGNTSRKINVISARSPPARPAIGTKIAVSCHNLGLDPTFGHETAIIAWRPALPRPPQRGSPTAAQEIHFTVQLCDG